MLPSGGSVGGSVVGTVAPGLFPDSVRGHGGMVAVYFESAAVIVALVLLGQVLELRAREQTSGAIRALLDLAPKNARRLYLIGNQDIDGCGEVTDIVRVGSRSDDRAGADEEREPGTV